MMKASSLLLTIALLLPASGHAAEAVPWKGVTGAFFALSVSDVQASTKWYAEKLGLKVKLEVPEHDGVSVVVLEGGGLTVELIRHGKAAPAPAAIPLVHGLFKAGLVVDDFDRVVATLRARGVELVAGPFPAKGDQRANVVVKDNAGNLIQFFGK
jgi:catechol 2,3-dioxygenase-like lactoylglutathione lyase family enzyme